MVGRAAPGTRRGHVNGKSGITWDGGAVWVCRTRRKPRSAVRPSRWRLCVRALAKQCFASKAPSPLGARWRLARVRCPAHTARPGLGVLPNPSEACLGPMAPTVLQTHTAPPLTDSVCCWWVSTLVDTVDPRHAWMNLCQASKNGWGRILFQRKRALTRATLNTGHCAPLLLLSPIHLDLLTCSNDLWHSPRNTSRGRDRPA